MDVFRPTAQWKTDPPATIQGDVCGDAGRWLKGQGVAQLVAFLMLKQRTCRGPAMSSCWPSPTKGRRRTRRTLDDREPLRDSIPVMIDEGGFGNRTCLQRTRW
jgi:hypothetical protein